jgi:hypothetical protein
MFCLSVKTLEAAKDNYKSVKNDDEPCLLKLEEVIVIYATALRCANEEKQAETTYNSIKPSLDEFENKQR